MEDTVAEWKASVIKQVGEDNWKRFIEYSREQRMSNYGLKEFSHDPHGLAKLALAKRQAMEKSLTLLKDVDLEPDSLKTIHRKFSKEIDSFLSPAAPKVQRLEIVPESKVPEAILKGKTNPWTIRRPPYDGWAWSYWWGRRGGQNPDLANYVNSMNGSVGHRSYYSNYDAGDFDSFLLDFNTSLGIWYLPSHPGQVEIYIAARCASAHYHVYLDDEFGWSDSGLWMNSYITVNVSPVLADEETSVAWRAHTEGNPNNMTYSNDVIRPNSILFFHFITSDPVPDAWTYISFGTFDHRWEFLNDVSTTSIMRNWWYISSFSLDVL
jgi:hypothetical protein